MTHREESGGGESVVSSGEIRDRGKEGGGTKRDEEEAGKTQKQKTRGQEKKRQK